MDAHEREFGEPWILERAICTGEERGLQPASTPEVSMPGELFHTSLRSQPEAA
jgi:hypothetical protein